MCLAKDWKQSITVSWLYLSRRTQTKIKNYNYYYNCLHICIYDLHITVSMLGAVSCCQKQLQNLTPYKTTNCCFYISFSVQIKQIQHCTEPGCFPLLPVFTLSQANHPLALASYNTQTSQWWLSTCQISSQNTNKNILPNFLTTRSFSKMICDRI